MAQPNSTQSPTRMSLADLPIGHTAIVKEIHTTGLERRRMMDLGILPDTKISVAMGNPLGDPRAYEVRGAVVALRKPQACLILVEPIETEASA